MHEMSLVRSLLRQVSELLLEHNGDAVKTIHVEMGPLAGVERVLVELAFEQLIEDSLCRGAQLVIDEVPLSAICLECDVEFDIKLFRFVCRDCESQRIRVTGGDEFRLIDVDIEVTSGCEVRT
ncbi:MAG: hydrogenase maturation nickel metallochaperone HypA [Planctomycetaceae bacterium]|nr:hydrogenase maturation nickel metallochaperone HypA [Planctomycetaceae bacterium]